MVLPTFMSKKSPKSNPSQDKMKKSVTAAQDLHDKAEELSPKEGESLNQPDLSAQVNRDTDEETLSMVEAARSEAKAMQERYLRAAADFENFRKRAAREKQELAQFAAARLIEELLPILDHFQIGIEAAEKQPESSSVTQGFKMVYDQLQALLSEQGLQPLNPLGDPFDPNKHECVAHQPSPEASEGIVTAVTRIGYCLHERLLRPASVVVSSGPSTEKEASPEDSII